MRRTFLVSLMALALIVSAAACSKFSTPTTPTGDAPVVKIFAADSSRITNGQTTILRWEVTGIDVSCRIDPQIGNGLPSTGNVEVRPSGAAGTQWTFTLACSNKFGDVNRTLIILIG